MKIRRAAWKPLAGALALIFIFAGAVPAKTSCKGVCICSARPTAKHHVHQAHRDMSHSIHVDLLKSPQPLRNPWFGSSTHDPDCHEETTETCHMELAQSVAVFHRKPIAGIQADHSSPSWVAATVYPFLRKGALSTGNAFREWIPVGGTPVPLYLQHLALIC